MQNLTPIQKIDAVLNLFPPDDGHYSYHKREIIRRLLDKHISFEERVLDEILLKLQKDGYMRFEMGSTTRDVKFSGEQYLITFEGELFKETGGYTNQHTKIIPRYKLRTGLINVAAVIAGVYYFCEIVKTYIVPVFQHVCACHFVWQ